MQTLQRLNTVTHSYTGNTTFKADPSRGYFFVVFDAAATIAIGEGATGEIAFNAGDYYAPPVVPIGPIVVETAGDFVVHSNSHLVE